MRTTLTIDDDVYESVNAIARAANMRLGAVVSKLLRERISSPPVNSEPQSDDFPFAAFADDGSQIDPAVVRQELEDEAAEPGGSNT